MSVGRDILGRLEKTTRFNAWLAEAIRPHVRGNILEIGAGIGNISAELCGTDSYIASDVEEESLNYMRQRFLGRMNLRVERVDIESSSDFAALKQPPDTIVCLNVLEHVQDDLRALRNLRSALPKDGLLVLLVPQLPWAFCSLDEALGHVRRYGKDDILTKLHAAGFKPFTVFDFNRASLPGWILNGKILQRRRFGRFQLKLFDSLVWLWRRFDSGLPWPGQSLIVVSRAS